MCAGDGLCTQGVIEVLNNNSDPISFRTHSASCTPGSLAVDSWGTSKEEIVPDILNASGMCSYRSVGHRSTRDISSLRARSIFLYTSRF